MDAATLRARADRCRELGRVAVDEEMQAQFRQWAAEFDEEAEAAEAASAPTAAAAPAAPRSRA